MKKKKKKKIGLYVIFLIFNNKWATKIGTGLGNPILGTSPGEGQVQDEYLIWISRAFDNKGESDFLTICVHVMALM
jgi:hypothetical protein